jgi:internalin A
LITEALWSRFEAVLKDKMPQEYAALKPPASEAQIHAAEQAMDVVFPEDLKFIYRKHNGIDSTADFAGYVFFRRGRWCALEEMVSHWQMMAKVRDEEYARCPDLYHKPDESWQSMMAQPLPHHKKWVPFALSGGHSFFSIDLAPAPAGVPNQIIREGCSSYPIVIAPSLKDWIEFFCDSFESGALVIDENREWVDMRTGQARRASGLDIYWKHNPDKLKPGVQITRY